MFYFDFRNKKAWEHDKQIAELDKVISFEDENIKICLSNSEMQGLCLDLGCGPGTTTEIIANNMEIKKFLEWIMTSISLIMQNNVDALKKLNM